MFIYIYIYIKPTLIRENQFVCNITRRKYFAIDIKSNEVHCKLQDFIVLLTCAHFGIQYVVESITPLNPRMDIHIKGKSGREISIDHNRIACKSSILSILLIESKVTRKWSWKWNKS